MYQILNNDDLNSPVPIPLKIEVFNFLISKQKSWNQSCYEFLYSISFFSRGS